MNDVLLISITDRKFDSLHNQTVKSLNLIQQTTYTQQTQSLSASGLFNINFHISTCSSSQEIILSVSQKQSMRRE